jgi:hypothetical protein
VSVEHVFEVHSLLLEEFSELSEECVLDDSVVPDELTSDELLGTETTIELFVD